MIRPANADENPWIRDLGVEVYGYLGDYRHIIPAWLNHPSVETHISIDEATAERQGFTIVGIYRADDLDPGKYIADLLAIAIAPMWQGHGLGRKLLDNAIVVARHIKEEVPMTEMRLTVADTNTRARQLFVSTGFEVMDQEHGHYAGGQIAIRMHYKL